MDWYNKSYPLKSREMKGFKNPKTKFNSEEEIHKICKMMQDKPNLSCSSIARLCKVSKWIVLNILKGEQWKEISSQYDFSERKKVWSKYDWRKKWTPVQDQQNC